MVLTLKPMNNGLFFSRMKTLWFLSMSVSLSILLLLPRYKLTKTNFFCTGFQVHQIGKMSLLIKKNNLFNHPINKGYTNLVLHKNKQQKQLEKARNSFDKKIPHNSWQYRTATTTSLSLVGVGDDLATSMASSSMSATDTTAGTTSTGLGLGVSVDTSYLYTYFWQVVITNGVPALFTIIVIAFFAWKFRPRLDDDSNNGRMASMMMFGGNYNNNDINNDNSLALLYDDLYGDQDQDPLKRRDNTNFLSFLFTGSNRNNSNRRNNSNNKLLPKNTGIPAKQYVKVTNLNTKYDSYQFSIMAATQSKAIAAASYRQRSFRRAIGKAIISGSSGGSSSSTTSLDTTKDTGIVDGSTWNVLQRLEERYMKSAIELFRKQTILKQQVTEAAIYDVLRNTNTNTNNKNMNVGFFSSSDNDIKTNNKDSKVTNATSNSTSTESSNLAINSTTDTVETLSSTKSSRSSSTGSSSSSSSSTSNALLLNKIQMEIQNLELNFIQDIIRIVGPESAPAIQVALNGAISADGGGGGSGTGLLLLSIAAATGERPLERIFGGIDVEMNSSTTSSTSTGTTTTTTTTLHIDPTTRTNKKTLYVMNFPGDVTASQVSELRELVTAIVLANKDNMNKYDKNAIPAEALVILQSGGGTVTGYGLAAAQLLRIKDNGMKLTVCVEQVAASGGYMMACIADKIIASPFAVLGSIGVISDIPNVYERLKKEGIEFQTITAGKFKRTLTPTKKVTKEDYDKSKQDIEDIYRLFRSFVAQNRPQLDIDSVATGETWFGTAALERKLCDEIKTVDETLTEFVTAGYNVYQLQYKPPLDDDSTFGRLFQPAGTRGETTTTASDSALSSLLEQPIRWFVRTVAKVVKDEIVQVAASSSSSLVQPPTAYGVDDTADSSSSVENRYMAKDDIADRIWM